MKLNESTLWGLINLAVILLAAGGFFIVGLLVVLWLFDRDTLALILWQ